MATSTLVVDWIACDGRGLCAELLPEVVRADAWGYPIVSGEVTEDLAVHAKRAVSACPRMALTLRERTRTGR